MSVHTKDNQTVTSAGNAWIICRSKSYSGRIYYFNTLTGRAAWNLSPPEIEKAKQRTKTIDKQNGGPIEDCPEPIDPPKEFLNVHNRRDNSNSPSTVYNKQIINNQFTKQPYPLAIIPAQCIPGCSNVGLNSEAIGLNVPPQNYNPNVWAIAPQQTIFLASGVQSLLNQVQPALNIACNNLRDNAQPRTPLQSNDYQSYGNVHKSPYSNRKHISNRHMSRNKRVNWQRYNTFNKQREYRNSNSNKNLDLRQVLRAKRNIETIHEATNDIKDHQDDEVQQDTSLEKTAISDDTEEAYHTDCDTDWLEENIHVQGSKLTLDVSGLRALAREVYDPECWYIAVDKNILLRHLNFLNILLNSDEQCHLMVPREVHQQLQSGTGPLKTMKLISRAQVFVSQRLEAETAVIADELSDNKSELPHIVSCCLYLQEQYYHVVLLSNDIELQRYKTDFNLPIFSIKCLKQFLSQSVNKVEQSSENENIPEVTENQSATIKITIENNTSPVSNEKSSPIRCKTLEQLFKHCQTTCDDANLRDPTIPVSETTKTKAPKTNIEVQTDQIEANKTNSDIYKQPNGIGANVDKKVPGSSGKIRLKRSTSYQTSHCGSNNSNKKQFRWRKKRQDSNKNENSNTQYAFTQTSFDSDNKHYCENDMDYIHHESNEPWTRHHDRSYNDFVEGSESCSSVILRNVSDKIVIEETSTSGIISNSASNIESELDTTPLYKSSTSVPSNTKELLNNEVVMFEITDKNMEDHIRMRCDEWVSRFVQIMEEVLTQILQRDSLFLPQILPPPWNLKEATVCIGMKFDNKDVCDAANMLMQVHNKICDEKGGIPTYLEPKDYMEMYSYGVYLVDSLQSAVNNCEDIQTAAESLSKLLNDIQNAELQYNDHFGDHPQESTEHQEPMNCFSETDNVQTEGTVKDIERRETPRTPPPPQLTPKHSTPSTDRRSYNLRSTNSKDKQHSPQSAKFTNTVSKENDFFSGLNLQKISLNETGVHKSPEISFGNISDNQNVEVTETLGTNKNSILDKFVSSFKNHPSYKEKLSDNVRQTAEEQDKEELNMDELDYSEDINYEYEEENYDNGYENHTYADLGVHSPQSDHGNEVVEMSDANENDFGAKDGGLESPSEDKHKAEINNEIENVYSILFTEMKNAFSLVNKFCENVQNDFSVFHNTKKLDTLRKAEKAYLCIEKIINSLKGILSRNGNDSDCDERDKIYKEIVMKSMVQAEILLKAVEIILVAVKS